MLLAAARATRHIRLGAGVSLLPLHHPLRVAEDYALLDQLSGGRLDFGVGRGFLAHEFAGFGIPMEHSTERFREAFEVVMQAWSGEPFAHHGEHFRFERLALTPLPRQRPPPVWVAAAKTRESFEWAGRRGFNLMLNRYPMDDAKLVRSLEWYLAAYEEAGHDPGRRETMLSLVTWIGESEEAAVAEIQGPMQRYLHAVSALRAGDPWRSPDPGDLSVFAGEGLDGSPRDFFRRRTLVGTAGQVLERLEGYRAAGFDEISFLVRIADARPERVRETIEALERDVRPRLSRPGP
jgi:alkanesulfonate monooxygenase SsuD/methylene tetrahydromethanopterin reductase-like flavin-dependent oxidoreductase (luciferase family)